MQTSHDVRVFTTETYAGKRKTTYRVRWSVERKKFGKQFATSALADSFRSKLVVATRRGEDFDTKSGLPSSLAKDEKPQSSWYKFACKYADMKWPDSSPRYRKSLAESLTRITIAMLQDDTTLSNDKELRRHLMQAFNKTARESGLPEQTVEVLNEIDQQTRQVSELAQPEILRSTLRSLDLNLDGKRASANTIRIRRTALGNAIDYAIECDLLDTNPLLELKVKKRNYTLVEVNPECVVNPLQGRMLIDAVGAVGEKGQRLKAFFGAQYYAGCRPEEAADIKRTDLVLPDPVTNPKTRQLEFDWCEIRLHGARPEVQAEWTDSGEPDEARGLKHRPDGTVRIVPGPPALTRLFWEHLELFGTWQDGRLFYSGCGSRVSSSTYGRVWARARAAVFTEEVIASALGKRPYDLRHAFVSTCLSAGVEATRVAKWAGHSLSVLLRVYAKCLAGGEKAARDRSGRALEGW